MAAWYLQILWAHVGCVIASGSLFFTRGCMMLAGLPAANHVVLRRVSVVIDSLLLIAAIALTTIIHQYPFVQAWLTVKVVLLVVYIVLGVFALRRGRTRAIRGACFIAAMAVFLFIVSVARPQPLGNIHQPVNAALASRIRNARVRRSGRPACAPAAGGP